MHNLYMCHAQKYRVRNSLPWHGADRAPRQIRSAFLPPLVRVWEHRNRVTTIAYSVYRCAEVFIRKGFLDVVNARSD